MEVLDSNGNILITWDTVTPIKDLAVKGLSKTLKRWEKIKNIKTVEDDFDNVECRIGKSIIVLKTCFLKKL